MKSLLIIILSAFIFTCTYGQEHNTHHSAHKHIKGKKNAAPKVVKQPVTDITMVNYSYYDQARGGYIFMENGRQSFLPALPILPESKPVKTSVPLTRGLDLDLYPQQHYPANNMAANSH